MTRPDPDAWAKGLDYAQVPLDLSRRVYESVRNAIIYFGLSALLSLQGCGAGWRQPARLSPQPLPAHQQVQIWQRGRVARWHAVTLTDDSITGIPYLQPVACPGCRVALARPAVDSIRMGDPVAGFWKTVGLIVAIPTVGLMILCGSHGGCAPD